MNDPRVGQSPAIMDALRAQNRLTRLSYHGMYQAYEGRNEVNAVKAQLASLLHRDPPGDVAAQAKKLEADLTKIGGKKPAGGILAFFLRHHPKPGALQSFVTLNNNYNTMVSMMQVGYDMAPTPTQIATWESDCHQYNRTVTAWKAMQTTQLAEFNTLLAKHHLQELNVAPTKLADRSCSFNADSN
jgi:hypothetical protein